MSTIYDTEAAINKAVADRARLPAMIAAAMREHKRAPTAQGALSLARSLSGFMVLTGSDGTATTLLIKALLSEAATLGATAADVHNVMQSALDAVRKMSEGFDAVDGPGKSAN